MINWPDVINGNLDQVHATKVNRGRGGETLPGGCIKVLIIISFKNDFRMIEDEIAMLFDKGLAILVNFHGQFSVKSAQFFIAMQAIRRAS
jgi:hypothetical protein